MEYKAFETEFQVKADDSDGMSFESYASTFGNEDEGKDIVQKGAFKRTINNRFKKSKSPLIKVLRGHWDLIGIPTHMEEDSTGLLTDSKLSKTPLGEETMLFIRDGVLNTMSIGFRAIKSKLDEETGVRTLTEIKLFEYSVVAFPMNEQAIITGTKALEFMKDSNVIQMLEQLADKKFQDAIKELGLDRFKQTIKKEKENPNIDEAIIALRSTATALENLVKPKDSPKGTPKEKDTGFDPAALNSLLADMKSVTNQLTI